ncbi:hypothetical protein ABIF38_003738 [Bradyrhizobium japonicum]|uniref:Uncharacterized protein n=1 Tax=Bradyrhizobium elkanii TaxID=29448 RepID=A0ABV4FAX2_BRAEL|nr:hypothetical protein [Bradyrhizobium elkanii]MBP2432739.1 hypothetical protein [Bradyrhizobium elkanii]MCP1733945.1 hypothetical protein [Bradyrhizobium elkanii]MCP1751628.1 hypothetical protein [Bradyrhizobium elkanii]MCP1977399.1 hypothetical protein [Bradyrhizobium elkanii]MCS3569282.1 hypothetical protein [Bradyrhizobium elkanii]
MADRFNERYPPIPAKCPSIPANAIVAADPGICRSACRHANSKSGVRNWRICQLKSRIGLRLLIMLACGDTSLPRSQSGRVS